LVNFQKAKTSVRIPKHTNRPTVSSLETYYQNQQAANTSQLSKIQESVTKTEKSLLAKVPDRSNQGFDASLYDEFFKQPLPIQRLVPFKVLYCTSKVCYS